MMQNKQRQRKTWLISLRLRYGTPQFSYLAALLLAVTLSFSDVAGADGSRKMESLRNTDASISRLQQRTSKVSSGDAANIARSAIGGRVLSVRQAGGAFKVKILKANGVVRNISVDKSTGNIRR